MAAAHDSLAGRGPAVALGAGAQGRAALRAGARTGGRQPAAAGGRRRPGAAGHAPTRAGSASSGASHRADAERAPVAAAGRPGGRRGDGRPHKPAGAPSARPSFRCPNAGRRCSRSSSTRSRWARRWTAPTRPRRLHDAVASMSADVLRYRGLHDVRDELLAWLAQRAIGMNRAGDRQVVLQLGFGLGHDFLARWRVCRDAGPPGRGCTTSRSTPRRPAARPCAAPGATLQRPTRPGP